MDDELDRVEKCSLSEQDLCQRARNSINEEHPNRTLQAVEIVLNVVGGILVTSHLLASSICILKEDVGRAHLISTLFLASGISSVLMYFVSSKYVVNGTVKLGYLICSLSLLNQLEWKCPGDGDLYSMGPEARTTQWKDRLRELQGATLLVSGVHIATGLVGKKLTQIVKPVHMVPVLVVAGLTVTKTAAVKTATEDCGGLFLVTVLVIGSLYYIANYNSFLEEQKTENNSSSKVFLAVIGCAVVWIGCAVFSTLGLINAGSPARTDVYTGIFEYSDIFSLRSLFQWGVPTLKTKSVITVAPALLLSVFETLVIEYKYNTASIRVDNRRKKKSGITCIIYEGICCFIASGLGAAINISMERCAKKRNIAKLCTGIVLIMAAFCGTFCACLSIIPEPIISALVVVVFLVTAINGYELILLDTVTERKVYVVAISVFSGIIIPDIAPGICDGEYFKPLAETGFFVSGIVSVVLDTLLPDYATEKANDISVSDISTAKADSDTKTPAVDICECFSAFFA